MAISPVFIADTNTLKAALRLSGAVNSDAVAMINTGMQQARLYLFRILGATRVTTIQGYAFNENAASDTEVTRLKANMTELALVRIFLMRTMPILFMDASGVKREVWNEEGMTRRAEMKSLQDEIDRLQLDIDMWLTELIAADGVAVGDVQGGVMEACVPCPSPLPISHSIQGGYRLGAVIEREAAY